MKIVTNTISVLAALIVLMRAVSIAEARYDNRTVARHAAAHGVHRHYAYHGVHRPYGYYGGVRPYGYYGGYRRYGYYGGVGRYGYAYGTSYGAQPYGYYGRHYRRAFRRCERRHGGVCPWMPGQVAGAEVTRVR